MILQLQLKGTASLLPADHPNAGHHDNWFFERLRSSLSHSQYHMIEYSMYSKECDVATAIDDLFSLPISPDLTWLMFPCIKAMHLSKLVYSDNIVPFLIVHAPND